MSRDLADLHPAFRPLVERWLNRCAVAGYDVLIYFTRRTHAEQAALYAQGRQSLAAVNALRVALGWPTLSMGENIQVTKARAGSSWHEPGLALDFVPLTQGTKAMWLYLREGPYDRIVEIARDVNPDIIWGGEWEDYGHLEWHPGLTLADVRAMDDAALSEALASVAVA